MPWAKPCHSPFLVPGSSLSSRPSKSTLGNETTNHHGSVSPILQGKKHIQWQTLTFTDRFYVRVNKLKSWVSICKQILWWSLLSPRDLFCLNYWRICKDFAWGKKRNHCRSSRAHWHGATEKQPYEFHIQADKTKSYCNAPCQLEGRAQQPPVYSIAFGYSWKY